MQRKNIKYTFKFLVITLLLFLSSCSKDKVTEKDFVGLWKSSKLSTPVELYANHEWEIKKEDGTVLQYGVWSYKDKQLIWTFKTGIGPEHDVDPIVSVAPKEFKVIEADSSVTVFSRIE